MKNPPDAETMALLDSVAEKHRTEGAQSAAGLALRPLLTWAQNRVRVRDRETFASAYDVAFHNVTEALLKVEDELIKSRKD